MARARLDLPSAAAIRALADDQGLIAVRVTPGARDAAMAITDGRILVKVRVPPEDGKATAAVMALLAQALGIGVSRIGLVRGAVARDKVFRIPPAA